MARTRMGLRGIPYAAETVAVAQVLAYVYQLKMYKKGKGQRPKALAKNLPIPEGYRH